VDAGFKERVTAAFDGLAARYDTERGGFFGPVSDLLVRAAGLRPGQAVLDVGCGAGACLFAAARAVGPDGHVTGIDLAAGMLARAAATAARLGLAQVGVEAGDAEDPAYPDGSFDVVLASPDAWWEASWNQAPALFWDKIPEPDLRAARARAVALLEPLRAADGSLRRGLGFCYTRAAAAVPGPANPSARPEAR
jgi:SAM-dependent methyltransferase